MCLLAPSLVVVNTCVIVTSLGAQGRQGGKCSNQHLQIWLQRIGNRSEDICFVPARPSLS